MFHLKLFEHFSPKNSKFLILAWRSKHRTQKTQRQQPNFNHVTRKTQIDANMKKSIQVKLLDFYKTKTNKSCVDMFSFLQSRLIMTQTMELARLPLLGKTSKSLSSKQNCKKDGIFKQLRKHGFHWKSVRRIKKNYIKKTSLSTFWNNSVEQKGPEKNQLILDFATRKNKVISFEIGVQVKTVRASGRFQKVKS